MKRKRWLSVAVVVTLVLAVSLGACAAPAPAPAPKPAELPVEEWVMISSGEGSFGFRTATGMARVASLYAKSVNLTVLPGYSTTASHTVYDKGEGNIAYSSLLSLKDSWANTGAFAEKPLTHRVYHGIYLFSSVHFVMTTADRTDINNLHDLIGKKFHPMTTGSGSHLLAVLLFGDEGLGIWGQIDERQMARAEITDAMRTGVIDAVWVYAVSAVSLTSTWQDLELRTDLRVVEPSAEEKAVIEKIPGIVAPFPVDAKIFTKPIGVDTIWGTALLFSFNFGPREDEERVYQIVKAWDEHADELVAIDKGFAELEKMGVELSIAAYDALPDIPVHPGVAKYLKEKGLWKTTWKIGEVYR